jgi:hypothetical protein
MADRYLVEGLVNQKEAWGPSDHGVYEALARGASAMLDMLVAAFSLSGKAVKSLSTALGVRAVRQVLGHDGDFPLTLEHVARGADAVRHLTPALIAKSVSAMRRLLDVESVGATNSSLPTSHDNPNRHVEGSGASSVTSHDEATEATSTEASKLIIEESAFGTEFFDIYEPRRMLVASASLPV